MTATATATVTLDTPIARGDQPIAVVTLRKPTAGELRGLSLRAVCEADVDAMIVLLPRITNPPLTEAEVAAMDTSDFVECGNQVAAFLPQRGSSTASPTA